MPSTTINRGNILSSTLVSVSLGAQTIAGASGEVSVTIQGVVPGSVAFATFSGTQTTGVACVNARVTAANTVSLQFVNATGSSAVTVAGNYYILIAQPENLPLPSNLA